ncbi:MAG: heme-degrading domain-containing protein [Devosia sp.]
MDSKQMIEAIRAREKSLVLPSLSHDKAWQLGEWLRARALASDLPLYVEVFINGGVRFAAASPRAHNNLAEWVRRKRNLVLRMGQSSYLTDLVFEQWGISLEPFGMNQADYGLGGGGFPIHVADVSIIGALTISGLPSIDDHNLVVECLAEHLAMDFAGLKLTRPASE